MELARVMLGQHSRLEPGVQSSHAGGKGVRMKRGFTIIAIASMGALALGCQSKNVVDAAAADGSVTVSGQLVAVKDDRPADGGVDLTIATQGGQQEILRIGSIFIANPREELMALHRVVDASKIGDRLKAI